MLIVYSKKGSQTGIYQSRKSIYFKTENRCRMYLSFFIVWGFLLCLRQSVTMQPQLTYNSLIKTCLQENLSAENPSSQ